MPKPWRRPWRRQAWSRRRRCRSSSARRSPVCSAYPSWSIWAPSLLGYPTGKQALYAGLSLVVAMMLPNWVMGLIRRPYQKALRRGIPDALDLMVVCAEAGLGLESAVERVAQEMKQSNRPVGVEFSLLMPRDAHHARPQDRPHQSGRTHAASPPSSVSRRTIAQTLKYGTPLSQGLRTLAAEMRNERMIQFEERAGKLPALLVMPMILFILPCLFIILMGKPVSQLMACTRQHDALTSA